MNRRGAVIARGGARIPAPNIHRETIRPKTATETMASRKWTTIVIQKQDEMISTLATEIQVLKKKLAFLQKTDVCLLGDEACQGDVTFLVQNDTMIKAHRFVLASKSSMFKKMFATNMKEKHTGQIYIEDVSGPIMRAVIEFLYTAEISFNDETTALEVFRVAHKYDIPELQSECETHLFNSVTEENLSEMLRISYMYDLERLMQKSTKIFKENFDRVHSKVFSDLLS